MTFRTILRSPFGESITRDIVDGRWAQPSGEAESTLGEDLWALPGLADAHAHLASAQLDFQPGNLEGAIERARASLQAGVTLILDKGWTDDTTLQMMEAVPAAERPDIEAAARIIADVDGYYPGFGVQVDHAGLLDAVGEEAKRGAGWVKLIGDWPRRGVGPVANFDQSQLQSAVDLADSVGAKVAIHTMAPEVPSMAVAAGVDSIEHGLFLEEADLGALGSRGGMWVPTVLRCEATVAQLGEGSSGGKLIKEGLERIRKLIPAAVEAGVHVLAGTDLIGSPGDVAVEALRLAEYGLSDEAVVAAVSTATFTATGRGEGFRLGAPANAVFFPADPVAEPKVLRHPKHVIRLGRLL